MDTKRYYRSVSDTAQRLGPPVLASLIALGAAALAGDELPFDFSAVNVADILANVTGGLKRDVRVLDKLDLTSAYVGDNHNHPGLSAFADLQATDGGNFSASVVGDAQVVSNIEAPAGVRVLDAWIAQDFDGVGSIKGGIIDLNSEFYVQPTGALFLNSAQGIGPDFAQAGQNGPSIFPATGFGLVGSWLPGDHWQLKAGVFEGTPGDPANPGRTTISFSDDEGALFVFEARNHITPDFVIGAGAWRYTASFDTIAAVPHSQTGNGGAYAIVDGTLYSAPEGDRAGLTGWVRAGFANDDINPIDATFGGGFVYTAPFDRQADQTGISVSYVHFGTPARHVDGLDEAETTFEATYSFAVNDNLILQPDLQYVVSPGGDPALSNALVIGSRVTATW